MRTRVAKAVCWVSSMVGRVRTSHRTYRLGARIPYRWTWRLASSASRIDPDHYPHWGRRHTSCDGRRCDVCGGLDCREDYETNCDGTPAEWVDTDEPCDCGCCEDWDDE